MTDNIGEPRHDFSNERPAYSIYPPAVARHLLFRLARHENPRFHAEKVERDVKWRDLCTCISDHINAVLHAYGDPGPDVEILPPDMDSDEDNRKYSARRTALVRLASETSHGYRLRIRVDIYTELFSISYLIDRIDQDFPGSLQERINGLPHDAANIEWLFESAWSAHQFPAGPTVAAWAARRDANSECARAVGDPIADFRGVFICPRRGWPMNDPSLDLENIGADEGRLSPAILSFMSQYQPLVRSVAKSKADGSPHNGTESIVCGMSGGETLYAAALGQWGSDANSITPLHHLLVYSGHSHAQLGRLVRQMHVMGELRHAAVLDWDLGPGKNDLSAASLKLRELGKLVDDAMPKVDGDKSFKPSIDKIDTILNKLTLVGEAGQGGLNYRIEQSRYYAQEFLNQLDHLRVVRVSGWQPYDEFVKRYILQLFDRIDRIGNRYEALGRRIDRLLSYEQASGFEQYHTNVRGSLSELSQLMKNLYETSDRQRKIMKRQEQLLKNAEYFALVFLIYYVGSIFHESVTHDPDFLGVRLRMVYWMWFVPAAAIGIPLAIYLVVRIILDVFARQNEDD